LCRTPAAGAASVCTRRCFSALSQACPNGFECVTDATSPERELCFPIPAAGCAIGGPSSVGPSSVLLLAVAWRRRRRRAT
jgi:hypothetical protein